MARGDRRRTCRRSTTLVLAEIEERADVGWLSVDTTRASRLASEAVATHGGVGHVRWRHFGGDQPIQAGVNRNVIPLAYTVVYGIQEVTMQRRAKVFRNNRSQAVRLPKEFQFETDEVFIRKEGEEVILSPRPADWGAYLENGPVASDAFMTNVDDLPVQEREP